ncbi:DNA-cytosine methyltransferase [Streptococcus saliviloxodontae]|uniref:Cytosine-specific methyltransferase n=1 Tax=Streptococcus saliviloxodontae TaxID=1349416 RepID=A0ABS2PJV5_9STRE|nr:DNA-cytosine methyltransferase [Streptococcus saliviloxodontae]
MYFIDLFAGIGGFRMGMEAAGHTCLAYCEIDKFARQSYQAMYNLKGEMEYHDIKQITDQEFKQFRGKVDVICGGFPCQAFSLAGRRLGFEDTRGTLFFEIARAAKQIKPRFLFLENVKGLLSQAGCPYDNAVAESTYRSFKLEFIDQETFQSLEELALKTKDYVHWWNYHRIHGSLNYQTPMTKRVIA